MATATVTVRNGLRPQGRWMRRKSDGMVCMYNDLAFKSGGFTEITVGEARVYAADGPSAFNVPADIQLRADVGVLGSQRPVAEPPPGHLPPLVEVGPPIPPEPPDPVDAIAPVPERPPMAGPVPTPPVAEDPNRLLGHDQLSAMNKQELQAYALQYWGMTLDSKLSKGEMIAIIEDPGTAESAT